MEIIEKSVEKNVLRIMVDSNEETLFSLLKTYLGANKNVDIVGVYREHYLINKTEFFLKVKKGDPLKLFKEELKKIKNDLKKKQVK